MSWPFLYLLFKIGLVISIPIFLVGFLFCYLLFGDSPEEPGIHFNTTESPEDSRL